MANQVPDRDFQDRNVEVPGDTNSADIVGRTGEQMPQQSHDGSIASPGRGPRAIAHTTRVSDRVVVHLPRCRSRGLGLDVRTIAARSTSHAV